RAGHGGPRAAGAGHGVRDQRGGQPRLRGAPAGAGLLGGGRGAGAAGPARPPPLLVRVRPPAVR
ncbi:unnamed protein product, partial [Heterosigma akashiwo]